MLFDPRRAIKTSVMVLALFQTLVLAGCRDRPTEPSPRPDPSLQVTPLDRSGPIRITFASATVASGSTIAGCGSLIEGCAGTLRMRFQLDPPSNGPVLYVRIYLHATNLIACLWGETPPFTVRAGVPDTIEIPLEGNGCATPTTIATMAVVVEGPIEVASRQTWSLHYVFVP